MSLQMWEGQDQPIAQHLSVQKCSRLLQTLLFYHGWDSNWHRVPQLQGSLL